MGLTGGPFTKHREKIQKSRETSTLKQIYKNDLDKACFAYDTAYSDSKDLAKRAVSDTVLKDRACEIAVNPKYDGYQKGLASMVYKVFDKKTRSEAKTSVNEELAQELHKPIIKKSKRRRVYPGFENNIWAADLSEMGSFSPTNRRVKHILCVIHVFTKYVWINPLKDKKVKRFIHGFIETANKSKRKPNKL